MYQAINRIYSYINSRVCVNTFFNLLELVTVSINKDEKIEPAERFTKSTAKVLDVSERVVRERVQAGEAILSNEKDL
jgi:hypothetical protein